MVIVVNAAFPSSHLQLHRKNRMAIKDIKAFSDLARTNPELKEKLAACQKIRELLTLAKEYDFNLDEQELYPPNEPQFTADQFSERLVKALLRA
jgi:predicted ribosomally synthesized peptide with nif11-like leader